MNNQQELNKIFSEILGINIVLNEDTTGYDKRAFVKIIENWEKAWSLKGELIEKFGILFDGYDGLLFEALEDMVVLMYGNEKAEVIQWYIYEGKDEEGKPYTLSDPNSKKSFTLKNASDLYDFIQLEFDIDNLPSLEANEEDDEDDE